jgi:hypothetical protein
MRNGFGCEDFQQVVARTATETVPFVLDKTRLPLCEAAASTRNHKFVAGFL